MNTINLNFHNSKHKIKPKQLITKVWNSYSIKSLVSRDISDLWIVLSKALPSLKFLLDLCLFLFQQTQKEISTLIRHVPIIHAPIAHIYSENKEKTAITDYKAYLINISHNKQAWANLWLYMIIY